jgi:hypothetical protein
MVAEVGVFLQLLVEVLVEARVEVPQEVQQQVVLVRQGVLVQHFHPPPVPMITEEEAVPQEEQHPLLVIHHI